MDCHGLTDVGRHRPENEDQLLVADLVKAVRIQMTSLSHDDQTELTGHSHGKVFLVADGMGGHAAGGRASTLAVDEMVNYMVNRMRWFAFSRQAAHANDAETLSCDLVSALKYCQERISNEADWNLQKQGMGTTLTVGIVDWPALHVVHVGDSRCYVYRAGSLQQVTRDHTVAQALVDAGELSEEEAEDSHLGNALWNVVGGPTNELEPEVYLNELSVDDTLLLCTDGLTRHVPDEAIAEVLRKNGTAEQACVELVGLANVNGGSDNITVIVARFLSSTPSNLQATARAESRQPEEAASSPGKPLQLTRKSLDRQVPG